MGYFKYDGTPAAVTAVPASNLWGGSGAETITGTSAAESLWGTYGDRLVGGGGDDRYYLQADGISVVEGVGGGVDRIGAWRSIDLNDFANVENVGVEGDRLYAAGNHLDNVVEGGSGAQQLYGGGGQDLLLGGAGADTFIVYKGEGNDVVQDFNPAADVLRLRAGFTSFEQVRAAMTQVGADVKLDLGGGDGLMLRDVLATSLSASNFQLQLDIGSFGPLAFADEFSGPLSLWDAESNPTGTWRPDYGYSGTQGVGSYTLTSNGEVQIFTSPYFRDHPGDFPESPFISNSDGTLSILLRESSNPEIFGYDYTSGMITTRPSFSQTYGYFEMRADVPDAAGGWACFWLLPTNWSWPPELDVMEVLTRDPSTTWTTQHSGASGSHLSVGQASFTPDSADGMHTYGLLWSETDLVWYLDGLEVFRSPTPADMHTPMFMIANFAAGGWGGTVDNAALPADFRIDYIRAYELDGSPTASEPPPEPPPPPKTEPPPPTTTEPAPPPGNELFTLPESSEWTRLILGRVKNDRLNGGPGADKLDGGAGKDQMKGGDGDDFYVVDRSQDTVTEAAGGGVDTVESLAPAYWLPANVENLQLIGGGVQTGDGNDLNNILVANDAGSTLRGGAGTDILVAGRGADTLTGGEGGDIFRFDTASSAADRITDFTLGQDMLDLRGLFVGYAGADPVADGRIWFGGDGAGGAQVHFDADGAGAGPTVIVVTLVNVDPARLVMQNDWFFM
jgi:Ca2+-binding RTX toxin-like protein